MLLNTFIVVLKYTDVVKKVIFYVKSVSNIVKYTLFAMFRLLFLSDPPTSI